jgi:hypothetical protein
MLPKTVRVEVEVPAGVSEATTANARQRAREGAILALWQDEVLSTRQAAAELDLTYTGFLDLLTERGLPVERGELNTGAIEAAAARLAGKQPG